MDTETDDDDQGEAEAARETEELGIATPRQLVEIFDMSGRKHRTGYADGGMFSVSGLAAGIYIIRIIENGTIKTSQKIIVN